MNQADIIPENILQTGENTVIEDGIKTFTVEALASKLGMSKKTIYKYVPSKEALLEKICYFIMGKIESQFMKIISRNKNPLVIFSDLMNFILGQIDRFHIQRLSEIKNRYPQIWQKVEEFRLARRDDFCKVFKEAQSEGYIRADLDIEVVATVYMNIINSTFQPEFFIQNNLAPVDTIRTFLYMITSGMFTKQGRERQEQIRKGTAANEP